MFRPENVLFFLALLALVLAVVGDELEQRRARRSAEPSKDETPSNREVDKE